MTETSRCVCCDAPVTTLGITGSVIVHREDRECGGPCPREDWPVLDAIMTDDDWERIYPRS